MEKAAHFFAPRVPISLWEIWNRWQQWGEQRGFPRSLEEELIFFEGFWEMLCDEFALDEATRREIHQFDYATCFKVYPDVLPSLEVSHARGLKVGVLSNFALASLEHSLQMTGLRPWIDLACAATVIGASKPEAAAYAIVAEGLGVALEHCLFFDDEAANVEGATASGMRAYLVDRTLPADDLVGGRVATLNALTTLLA